MIEFINVSKSFGEKTLYKDFNLKIECNKITVILGDSGSGKTTLLNMLLGETEYLGEIKNPYDKKAVVFQKDRLVGNLTVSENLKLVNNGADVDSALKEVELENAKDLYPKNLSGGMARRVAILRALIFNAPLILLDEPFINLDLRLKIKLIEKIKKMKTEENKTIITVTHDIFEAVKLADRIIVIKKGDIVYDTSSIDENTQNRLFDILSK